MKKRRRSREQVSSQSKKPASPQRIWKADNGTVTLNTEWDPLEMFAPQSLPIVLGSTTEGEGEPMNLFESIPVLVSETKLRHQGKTQRWLLDCACFAGGRIWAMDWLTNSGVPSTEDLHDVDEVLAVSVHSKTHRKNIIGSTKEGPGAVQIWSVCQKGSDGEEGETKMVMAVTHDGAVAWDVRWCPDPTSYTGGVTGPKDYSLLGILAVALGNGEVHFLCVPKPDEVIENQGLDPTGPALAVKLKPAVKITREDLCNSVVSCVDWLPHLPHDLVLLGCWDGCASIWQLPQGARDKAQLLMYHSCEVLAIRRALWLRPQMGTENPNPIFRYTFCTIGHSGKIQIWDMRSIYEPVFTRTLSRSWLMDAMTPGNPLSLYIALEDATLRQIPIGGGCFDKGDSNVVYVFGGNNEGAIWSMTHSEKLGLGAYGGEDGEIGVFEMSNCTDSRYRKPHMCAGSMKFENDCLRLLNAQEVMAIGGMYMGGSFYRFDGGRAPRGKGRGKRAYRMNENQLIHCVRFSPNGSNVAWLAAGSASGVFRLMRIAQRTPKNSFSTTAGFFISELTGKPLQS